MSEDEQTRIEKQTETYGFEGGSISLVPEKKYDLPTGTITVPPHIALSEIKASGKPTTVKILSQNGYDSLLRVLQSRKAKEHRQTMASVLSLDSIDS